MNLVMPDGYQDKIMEASGGQIWAIGLGYSPSSYDGQKWIEHGEGFPSNIGETW